MKRACAVLGVFALVALALPLSSQQGPKNVRGIYGTWDPSTGIFMPIHQAPAPNSDAEGVEPLTTYTGKIVVNFTITITSAISTSTTIACDANVTVVDLTGQLTDSLSTSATRSGSTATCTVTIPYSWSVSSTSDSVYISYSLSAPPQPLVSTSVFPRRYSGHPISTITVPANGATTTYNITDTL